MSKTATTQHFTPAQADTTLYGHVASYTYYVVWQDRCGELHSGLFQQRFGGRTVRFQVEGLGAIDFVVERV